MSASLFQVLLSLSAGIAVIILLTTKYKVHAFFALILACFVVGLSVQLPLPDIIKATKEGFGNIMKSLGLIIVLGTTLGVLLEYTGSTRTMANYILRKVGDRNAPFAMSITGFIVGLPIFCDSGYIVLSGLNQSLAKRTGISVVIMAVSLATGLYAVHCLVPPHPGAAAAAGIIGADFGKLILVGTFIAIPGMLVGYWWANFAGRKLPVIEAVEEANDSSFNILPSATKAFMPVLIPILLIGAGAFLSGERSASNTFLWVLGILGDPVVALSIGILLAFACKTAWNRETISELLQESAEKAGGILVIIGAGGAFGAVLATTNIGQYFINNPALGSLGLLFPFLVTSLLKTAQGSSTVAIITASSIVLPLLNVLGLDSENGKLLCVLAMGAGSMMVSHANDAYFWVIAKFARLDMSTMLRVYTVATTLMGLVSLLMTYLLSLIVLN